MPKLLVLPFGLLLSVPVLLGTIAIQAEIQVGEPHYFGTAARGGVPIRSRNLRAVATSWGYFAAWEEHDGLRAARIGRDGTLLDDPPLTFAPNAWLTAAPIFDGTDVVLAYNVGDRYYGPRRVELVRVTAEGTIIPLATLPQAPAEILWTGTSYILLVGPCTPAEAMQLDRNGSLLRSVAVPIPVRTTYCDPFALAPPRLIYRDGGGVFRLVHQTGTAETGYDSYTFALTDANGDPIGDGRLEPLDAALPRERLHGAGVMNGGLYLVAESSVHFTDFTGRPVRAPIRFDAAQLHAVNDGTNLLLAGIASSRQVVTWRITRDGTVTPLWPSPPDGFWKSLVSVFPFQSGAMVFFLEQLTDGDIPALWRVRNQRFGNRVQPPVPLVRGIPRHYDLAVVPLGSGMLALWQQQSPSYEVRAVMLDSSARETGPSDLVLQYGIGVRAASNGRVALVVVQRWQGLAVFRFGADGRRLDQTPLLFPGFRVWDVTWDGSAFLVQLRTHALRIDESGVPLTPEPVRLPFAGTLVMSADGPVLLHNRDRIPSHSATEALHALPLTDDLKPRGEPRVVSILPTFETTAVPLGDHHLVIFRHLDRLFATRIGADGAPLDGDLPRFLAELDGNHKVGHVRGRALLATESIVMNAGRPGSPVTRYEPVRAGEVGAIVAGPGGRTWLFYTKVEHDPRWTTVRPVARELFLD